MTNSKGESKMYFESLLKQYLETHALIEKKEESQRDYADEISSLYVALEEEHKLRLSLEKKIETHELSQNEVTSKLTKEVIIQGLNIKLLKRRWLNLVLVMIN